MDTNTLNTYADILREENPIVQRIIQTELGAKVFSAPNLRYWIDSPTTVDKTSDSAAFWNRPSAANIAAFLRLHGYIINEAERLASNDGGKNYVKIGKILTNLNRRLLVSWRKLTNTHQNKPKGGLKWVISAHPVDLVNATHGRKWRSCLAGGNFFRTIDTRFSLVAYLCSESDVEIKNPQCRYFIHIGTPEASNLTTSAPKSSIKIKFSALDKTPIQNFQIKRGIKGSAKLATGCLFFTDTLYGSCPAGYSTILKDYLQAENVKMLSTYGTPKVSVSISGFYVNGLPSRKNFSATPRSKSITKPTTDSLHNRCVKYRSSYYHYPTITYQMVEYMTKYPTLNTTLRTNILNSSTYRPIFMKNIDIGAIKADLGTQISDVGTTISEESGKSNIDSKRLTQLTTTLNNLNQQLHSLNNLKLFADA